MLERIHNASRLRKKFLLGLTIMAVILFAVISVAIARLYDGTMQEHYRKIAYDQAKIAADYIDGDAVERYYATLEKDAYYEEIRTFLLRIKQTVGLKYYYVIVPEDTRMFYIWDAGEEGEEGVCDLGDTDPYNEGGYETLHSIFSVDAAEDHAIFVSKSDTYGYLVSAYVPIFNSAGEPVAIASVDLSMENIERQILVFVAVLLGIIVAVLAVVVILYSVYIDRKIIAPLLTVKEAASTLVSSSMERLDEFVIGVHTGDEIEDLADAFERMTKELSAYIGHLAAVTAEKERIGAELDVATHIQKSMLPCIFPAFPNREEVDIYATMDPAKEVGGDFYDFFMVDDRHVAIVMADVSGKGVPAALFMVIGKTLIKDHTTAGRDLGEVFSEVNRLLCESNSEGLFITAFEGVLDLVTGEFSYVNAGHEMPFICRAGGDYEAYKIKPGFVLAGMEEMRYRAGSVTLAPGDKIFQYTDGVTEATNAENELYGMERLSRVLSENKGRRPAELLPAVKEDIDRFVGQAPQFDDITMLCLEYKCTMEVEHERTDT